MYLEKTVFAIDDNIDTHTVAKFLRHVDTHRAMGRLKGAVVHCIGSWTDDEGWTHLEPSFMMDSEDYNAFVVNSGYVDNQLCVLKVPGDTRQPCSLRFKNGYRQALGPMRETKSPHKADSWTYVQETGKYFTC